jgi:Restriction endonuclease fold toxin 5
VGKSVSVHISDEYELTPNFLDFTPDQNGPGEWIEVSRSLAGLETQEAFSGQTINYDPITGQASIKEYKLGGVEFDGYSNGTLGEVKGDYSIVLEDWFIQAKGGAAAQELISTWSKQAAAQVEVATQYGLPLEWYVPQDLLPLVQQVLGKDFPTITFVGY